MKINPFMIWLLRSPLHRILDSSFMLVTYKGRKTSRQITLPVNYVMEGGQLLVTSLRSRTWWRNLRDGAQVSLHLKGRDLLARAEVIEDELALQPALEAFIKGMPQAARYMKVRIDDQGKIDAGDLSKAVKEHVMVRFHPQ